MAGKLTSPYLNRKEIDLQALKAACGARVFINVSKIAILNEADEVIDTHEGVFVFRELVGVTGVEMGFERILDEKVKRYPDKKAGDKYLTRGASTSGFTPIGFSPSELAHLTGDIIVCCGLADGYRIHEATGLPVACGVGEHSLSKLAKMIDTAGNCFGGRVRILVAADNDNAGIAAAMRTGYRWVVPEVRKDWSDVYQEDGRHAIIENLKRVQDAVAADELPDKLAALGITSGVNRAAQTSKSNHWLEKEATDGVELNPIAIEIGNPKEIDGIDQYLALLEHIGSVESSSGRRIEARTLEAHALLISMLADGLLGSLPMTEQKYAEEHSRKVLTMASQGKLDDIEVVVRSPVLVTVGKDEAERAALRLSCVYDNGLKGVFRSAGGYWDKAARAWVLPAGTESRLDAVLGHLLSATLGRTVTMRVTADGEPGFITGTPERADVFKGALLPDIQRVWATQPAESPTEERGGAVITYAVTEKNGWPSVSILLPFDAQAQREGLKKMGGQFTGKSKHWDLPLCSEVLDTLEAWKAHTDGPGVEEIRHALEVCGFGHLESVNAETLAVSAPYHEPLIERLKDGLPRLARRFDRESMAWHVDVSSAVVAQELRQIADEFDLRLLDENGLPLPRNIGWDDVIGGRRFNNPQVNNSPEKEINHTRAPVSPRPTRKATTRGAEL